MSEHEQAIATMLELARDRIASAYEALQWADRLISELPDSRKFQNLGDLLEKIAESQDEATTALKKFSNEIETLKEKAKVLAESAER